MDLTKTQRQAIDAILKEWSETQTPKNYNDRGFIRRQVIAHAPNLLELSIRDMVSYITAVIDDKAARPENLGPPPGRPDFIKDIFVPASLRDPSHYITACVYGKKLWVGNKCFDSITEIKKAFNINQEGAK